MVVVVVSVSETQQEVHFTKGSVVEVSSDDDGFIGSWFVATILEVPTPKCNQATPTTTSHHDAFLVEYHTLVTSEDDDSKPLTEYAQSSFIRPLPPLIEDESSFFELNGIVDAFYRDGWWIGVISEVLEDHSKFRVLFQNPPEEVVFDRKELRVHQEWVGRNWVFPKKLSSRQGGEAGYLQETIDFPHIRPCPPNLGHKNFELLEKVDAYYEFAWWSGIITKVLSGGRYTVFFKQMNKDIELNHSELRPHMEWTGGKGLNGSQEIIVPSDYKEQYMQAHKKGDDTEVVIQLEKSYVAPSSPNSRKNKTKNSIPSSETPSCTTNESMMKTMHTDVNSDDTLSRPSKKLKENAAESGQSRMVLVETLTKQTLSRYATPTTGGTGTDCSEQPVVDIQPSATNRRTESDAKETSLGIRRGTRLRKSTEERSIGMKRGTRPRKSVQETSLGIRMGTRLQKSVQDTGIVKRNAGRPRKSLKEMGLVIRKGGRPRKSLLGSVQVSVSGKNSSAMELPVPGIVGLHSTVMKGAQAKDYCQLPSEEFLKLRSNPNEPENSKSMDIKDNREVGRRTQIKRKGRPRKHRTPEVPATESQDANGEKTGEGTVIDCVTEDVEVVVAELSNDTTDDDKPLSQWIDGMHPPTIVDDPRLSDGSIINQGNETWEDKDETARHSLGIDAGGGNVLVENQSLPFVKSSPIWKTIESMPVFQKMSQKPHFQPLGKCKEECREGLAIGSMVTFATLVEKISKLKFDEPRSIINSTLETIADLEMHGFDIKVIRCRLNELLLLKDKQEKLQVQAKQVEGRIVEHTREKTKVEENIDEIQKKLIDLQEKLSAAMSMKESKQSEIDSLKLSVDVVNESMQTVRDEFECLVAAAACV